MWMRTKMKPNFIVLFFSLLTFLLGCTSPVILKDFSHDDALLYAIATNDADFIARCIRNVSPDSLIHGVPLILRATSFGAADVIELLLAKGADRECYNRDKDRWFASYLESVRHDNTEPNDKMLALFRRDECDAQEEFVQMIGPLLPELYLSPVSTPPEAYSAYLKCWTLPYRLFISGLPSSVDGDKLKQRLLQKGFNILISELAPSDSFVKITLEEEDGNTYMISISQTNEKIGTSILYGKAEKFYGYWIFSPISMASGL